MNAQLLLRLKHCGTALIALAAIVTSTKGQSQNTDPVITRICPSSIAAVANPSPNGFVTIDVYGTNLFNTVRLDSIRQQTMADNGEVTRGNHLSANILEKDLATPGTHTIDVEEVLSVLKIKDRIRPNATGNPTSNAVPFIVLPPPTIDTLTPEAVTATAPFALGVAGMNFIPAVPATSTVPGCPAGTQIFINDRPDASASIQSNSQITLNYQANAFQPGQVKIYVLNNNRALSGPAAFTVNAVPAIVAPSLPTGVVGVPYAPTSISVNGGTAPFTWSIAPANSGFSISGSGAVATLTGTPTTAGVNGTVTFQVTVTDAFRVSASRALAIPVLPLPALTLTLPITITPGTNQPQVVTITAPANYPVPITGTLDVSFAGSPDVKVDANTPDASLMLSNTQFTLPGPTININPGTTAGTITVRATSVSVQGNAVSPSIVSPATTAVAAGPPQIDSCTLMTTAFGFHVRATGFSSTREISKATFAITPATGKALANTSVSFDNASSIFGPFYNANKRPFLYDQDLVVTGSALNIGTIAISLDNAKGTSAVKSCQ